MNKSLTTGVGIVSTLMCPRGVARSPSGCLCCTCFGMMGFGIWDDICCSLPATQIRSIWPSTYEAHVSRSEKKGTCGHHIVNSGDKAFHFCRPPMAKHFGQFSPPPPPTQTYANSSHTRAPANILIRYGTIHSRFQHRQPCHCTYQPATDASTRCT